MYRDVVFVFGFLLLGWLLFSGKFIEAMVVITILIGLFLLNRSISTNRKAEAKTIIPEREQSQPSNLPIASEPVVVNSEGYTARLQSRPKSVSISRSPGTRKLNLNRGLGRDGLIHVPRSYDPANPSPLIVWLHGGGMNAEQSIYINNLTDKFGCILLLPESRYKKWDFSLGLKFISVSTQPNTPGVVSLYAFDQSGKVFLCDSEPGKYGPDITFIDEALKYTFDNYSIDTKHLAIAGYSDGAAYALSVGITNGDLFTHIMAFAPVYSAPPSMQGKPSIFISHGTDDNVIPVEASRDLIVPELKRLGYDVHYHSSNDPHIVTLDSLEAAMMWFSE